MRLADTPVAKVYQTCLTDGEGKWTRGVQPLMGMFRGWFGELEPHIELIDEGNSLLWFYHDRLMESCPEAFPDNDSE